MKRQVRIRRFITSMLAFALCLSAGAASSEEQPLGIESACITIAGTTNVHPYTASTTSVRVTRAGFQNAQTGAEFWEHALTPGVVEAFELAIPAASLSSPKGDLDKNMHKALKVQEHAEITFRLLRFEPGPTPNRMRAVGVLRVAGVEREVAFDVQTLRKGFALVVKGELDLLMTDYGITPPKAMLGMLKTDPKVTLTFEVVLAVAST